MDVAGGAKRCDEESSRGRRRPVAKGGCEGRRRRLSRPGIRRSRRDSVRRGGEELGEQPFAPVRRKTDALRPAEADRAQDARLRRRPEARSRAHARRHPLADGTDKRSEPALRAGSACMIGGREDRARSNRLRAMVRPAAPSCASRQGVASTGGPRSRRRRTAHSARTSRRGLARPSPAGSATAGGDAKPRGHRREDARTSVGIMGRRSGTGVAWRRRRRRLPIIGIRQPIRAGAAGGQGPRRITAARSSSPATAQPAPEGRSVAASPMAIRPPLRRNSAA